MTEKVKPKDLWAAYMVLNSYAMRVEDKQLYESLGSVEAELTRLVGANE